MENLLIALKRFFLPTRRLLFLMAGFFLTLLATGLTLAYFQPLIDRPQPGERDKTTREESPTVLAENTSQADLLGQIRFNIPAIFNQKVTINAQLLVQEAAQLEDALTVEGKAILNDTLTVGGDITADGQNLNLGTGDITASNVIYSLTAGENITITAGQNPVISADLGNVVTSIAGETGEIELIAGEGMSITGLTITNDDPGSAQDIFKTITAGGTSFSASGNEDEVSFEEGSGISISASDNTITISSESTSPFSSSLTTNGILYANSATTATSLTPGTSGYVLQSNGTGSPPSWVANASTTPSFAILTSGTNTTAAMVVGSGASLDFTGSGTINASTLGGATFAAPAAIGSTTANTGAFTTLISSSTLTSTGLITASGGLTVASGQTITFSNLSTGILHANSAGVLSSSAINLASADVTDTLRVVNGGTGLSSTPINGQLLIGNGSGYSLATITAGSGVSVTNGAGSITLGNTGVTSISGTTNQIDVSANTGTVVLSLPQNINTAATATFASLTLLNNTNQITLGTGTTGTISMTGLTANRTYAFPDASGDICLSSGNCSGTGGTISGSGTTNYITKFTSSNGVGDSTIYDNGKIGIGTSSPVGLFNVQGAPVGQALVNINYTGSGQNIITASASGTTRLALDASGNLNIIGGAYQIGGTNVLSSTTLGASVVTSSLTSIGTLTSGIWNATAIGSQYGGTGQDLSGSTGVPYLNAGTWAVETQLNAARGGTGDDTTGITGVPYISSGNWQYENTLDETRGGTGLTSYTTGDLIYASGANTLANRTIGASGQILSVVGGLPTWVDAGASGLNYWQRNAGALAPLNITDDFLIGGTSTASARFQIFANTGNATTSGSLTFDTAALIQTTRNQTLTLGGNTTGDITLSPRGGSGTVLSTGTVNLASGKTYQINGTTVIDASRNLTNIAGISTSLNPTATNTYNLGTGTGNQYNTIYGNTIFQNGSQVCDNSGNCQGGAGGSQWQVNTGTLAPYTLSNKVVLGGNITTSFQFDVNGKQTGKALASLNETGDQHILTASASGTTVFNLARNGNFQFAGNTGLLQTLTSVATANRTYTLPDTTGTICIVEAGNCAGSGTGITGSGTATQIAFFSGGSQNLASDSNLYWDNTNKRIGIGTASPIGRLDIAGANVGKALTIFNETGDQNILTASASGITVMNLDRSGNLNIEGRIADLTGSTLGVNDSLELTTGNVFMIGGSNVLSATTLGSGVTASSLTSVGTIGTGVWQGTAVGAQYGGTGINTSASTGVPTISGGTWSVLSALTAALGGTGDDTSGTTGVAYITAGNWQYEAQLNVARGGTGVNGSTASNGQLLIGNGSGYSLNTLTAGTGISISNGSESITISQTGSGSSKWTEGAGILTPNNNTLDLLVGGASTASAKFAVLNVNNGTTTASVSAGSTGAAYLTANGTLQTTAKQTLTVGGDTTGNITLSPRNGSGTVTSTGTMNIATGKTYQINGTDVLSATTLGTSVVISSLTSVGALSSGSIASGFGTIATVNTITGTTVNGTTGINTGASAGTQRIDASGNLVNINNITAGGTITFSGLSTGVIKSNGSGVLSSSAVDLASADVTGVLPVANGGTNTNTLGSAGSVAYSNGTAYAFSSVGTSGQCLTSSGTGAPTWAICDGASSSYWNLSNGTLSAGNTTVDLLLGGNATASAKFAVVGINNGTPVATLAATSNNNGLSLDAASSTFQSTRNNTLTIGGNTTGNITLSPLNGSGTVTSTGNINLASGKAFQMNGTDVLSSTTLGSGVTGSSLTSVGTIGTGVWQGTAIGAQYGGTGLNTSASTGVPTISGGTWSVLSALTAALGGTGVNGSTASNGQLLIGNGSGYSLNSLTAGTGISITNGSGSITISQTGSGSSKWTEDANGTIYPNNPSLDLLIGGTSTASAKFAILNVSSGIPTASISAGVTGATYIAANGTLQTTTNQRLTIGGNTTGDITLSPQGGNGTVTSTGNLNLASGKVYQINGVSVLSDTTLGTSVVNSSLTSVGALSSGSIASGFGTIATVSTITGTTLNGTTGINTGASAGTQRIDASGNLVNITNITAGGTITFSGLSTGVVKSNGSGVLSSSAVDLASADVTGVLPIANGGTNTNTLGSAGSVAYSNGTAYAFSSVGSSGQCLTSGGTGAPTWATCDGTSSSYWNLSNGALSAGNTTIDLLVGGTSTTSANFALTGIASDAPVATLAASTNSGLSLDAANATLQSTRNNTLTIGGNTTGNITLSPLNGSGTVTSTGNINLASGKAYQINGTNVLTNNTLGSGVIASSLTSVGTLTSGTWNATAIGAQYGGTGDDTSGTTGVPYLSTGNWQYEAQLSASRGGTGVNGSTASNGQLLIGNGSGYSLATLTAGNGISITNGSGSITIAQNSANSSKWTEEAGILTPNNNTLDLLVGGSSTASAKFAVLNVSNGNTTASVSAGSTGAAYLTAAGTLATTNKQTLNLGNSSTGNILLNGGNVGIGTTNPNTALQIGDFTGYEAVVLGGANGLANSSELRFMENDDPSGYVIRHNSSANTLSFLGINNGTEVATAFTFTRDSGNVEIAPNGNVGIGTSTPTAKLDVNGTASISGALKLYGTPTIQTTANQTLTIGGNTTGDITLDPLSGSGTVTSTGTMNLASGKTYQINGTSVLSATTLGSGVTGSSLTSVGPLASGSIASGFGTIATSNTITGTTINGTTGINTGASAGTQRIDASGNLVNINNITAGGDITFSALTTNGGILYTNGSGTVAQTTAGSNGQCLKSIGGGTPTWGICGGSGAEDNYWQMNNGAVSPFSNTLDVLVGATATTSAKFGFLNVSNGTPTASVSAGATGAAYLTAAGTLATTARQTLLLGDTATGDIKLAPRGSTALTVLGSNGYVGIGTTTPGTKLHVVDSTLSQAIFQSTGSNRAQINIDNAAGGQQSAIGLQDAGTEKWQIGKGVDNTFFIWDNANTRNILATNTSGDIALQASGGNVGIGTTSPTTKLHVNSTTPGKALAIFNDTGSDQNILNASASGTTVMNLDRSGNLAIEGQLSDLSTATLTVNDNLNLITGNAYQINGTNVLTNNALGSGVTASSLTSVGTIGTGVWQGTAIASQYGGTGQNWSAVSQGAVPYFNGTGTMATLAVGTAGQCLMTGGAGANPSWSNCAAGANYWQLNDGAVSPFSGTADLLVGSTATSSAEFAILGIAAGTSPTASISATSGTNSGNGITLGGDGTIQSLSNNTLTIGGGTTGNITLSPRNGSGVVTSIGDLNLSSGKAFQINGTSVLSNNTLGSGVTASSLTSVGTLATGTWNATAIGSQYGGTGQNFSGSTGIPYLSTGTWTTEAQLHASRGGTGLNGSTAGNGTLLIGNGSGYTLTNLTAGSGISVTNGAGSITIAQTTGGQSKWTQSANGVLSPNNNTLDLLIGGTATSAAEFSVLGIAAGTAPTASISATSGANSGKGISLGGDGSIQSLSNSTLTIGGATTGNIVLAPNNTTALTLTGTTGTFAGDLTVSGGDIVSAATANLLNTTSTTINFAGAATTLNINDAAVTSTIDIGGVTNSGTNTINIATNGTAADAIAIGNTNAATTLALTGGDDWNMAATGILTLSASSGQTTAMVITDTDYTNSLSIADNNITGTTANIDLSNFDVVGSTGSITTAGDIAVNGDDITSDGNLTINATGYVRIGDTASPSFASGDDDLFVEGDIEFDGSVYTPFTQGSVTFAGANGALSQNNGNFFWDDAANELGIGTASPDSQLHLYESTGFNVLTIESDDPSAGGSVLALNRGSTDGFSALDLGTAGTTYWGSGLFNTDNNYRFWDPQSSNATRLLIESVTGLVGIGNLGTNSPLGTLDVRANSGTLSVASVSGQTSRAALLVDNNGVGSLFTASKSGATKFEITNQGAIKNYASGLDANNNINLFQATLTATSGLINANHLQSILAPSGNSTASNFGIYNDLFYQSGSTNFVGDQIAALNQVNWYGDGTSGTGKAIGSLGKVLQNTGGGSIANAVGVAGAGQFDGDGVASAAALMAFNPTGTGTVTNAYGLYVEGINKGTTNNYAIYSGGGDVAFNGDGRLRPFSTNTSNPLPTTLRQGKSVTANGYIYHLGGYNGTAILSSVYYAKANADGSTGQWVATTSMPTALVDQSVTVANGYIYIIGGSTSGANAITTVSYAKLNADGSIGSWNATSSLLAARQQHTTVYANGYLYAIGGYDGVSASVNTVYYAKANANGTLSSWTATNTLPAIRAGHSSVVANGFVYAVGGSGSTTVYYAKLNGNGTVDTWRTSSANPLPITRQYHGSVVSSGYMYIVGGQDGLSGVNDDVYYAKINADGTTGAWATNANLLPSDRYQSGVITVNGYIYVLGGAQTAGGAPVSTVYYGSTNRMSVGMNLDLIGLDSSGVASASGDLSGLGSLGGSIYAGNIFSNGGLEVTGNSQFWNGVGINGVLSVNSGTGTTETPIFNVETSAAATAAAMIWNTATSVDEGTGSCTTGPCRTGLIVKMGNNAVESGGRDRFILFQMGDGTSIGKIRGNSNGEAANGISYDTNGGDFAEYFKKADSSENIPYGSLVCLAENGGVTKCNESNRQILGVVSDMAGFTGRTDLENDPNYIVVGLVGQVLTYLSTENGAIKAGEYLSFSSDKPGYAAKATTAGMSIGRALADFDGSNPNKRMLILVQPGWHDPAVSFTADGNVSNGGIPLSTTPLTLPAETQEQLTAIQTNQTKVALDLEELTATVSAIKGDVASVKLTAQDTKDKVTGLSDKVASLEAALLSFSPSQPLVASSPAELGLDKLDINEAAVSGSLAVLGKTMLHDVGVTGKLTVGLLAINGLDDSSCHSRAGGNPDPSCAAASINTSVGDLSIQSHGLYGVDFMDGKLTIDKNGNLKTKGEIKAKKVTTSKLNIVTDEDATQSASAVLSSSAGSVVIEEGDISVDVTTSALTEDSLLFATPDEPVAVGTKAKDSNTFTIKLQAPAEKDIKVKWWIVN